MRNVELSGPSVGRQAGIADDREPAALHRAVERLRDDAGADAAEPPAVELGLAQDVEPQRRVLEQRLALGLR